VVSSVVVVMSGARFSWRLRSSSVADALGSSEGARNEVSALAVAAIAQNNKDRKISKYLFMMSILGFLDEKYLSSLLKRNDGFGASR